LGVQVLAGLLLPAASVLFPRIASAQLLDIMAASTTAAAPEPVAAATSADED
jgi:hypothetical protein